jgi:hypothetical protein
MFFNSHTRHENALFRAAYHEYLSQWGKPPKRFRNTYNMFDDWNFRDRRLIQQVRRLLFKRGSITLAAKKNRQD